MARDTQPQEYATRRSVLKALGGVGGAAALAGCSGGTGDGGGGTSTATSEEQSGGGDQTTTAGSSGSDSLRIGMETHFTSGAWVTALVEGGEFYAQERGYDFNLFTNEQDAQQQINHIQQMINQGYDGIVLVPWNSDAVTDAVEEARSEGIPTYTVDIDAPTEAVSMNISWSDEVAATKAANELLSGMESQRPDADTYRVLEVRAPPGQNISRARHEPFAAAISEADNAEIVGTLNGEWSRSTAKQRVREWINANDAPDGVYSANFTMGLGALNALDAQGLAAPKSSDDHITMVQLDGSSTTHQQIQEGFIDMAIDQPNYCYAPIAMQYLEQEIQQGAGSLPEVGAEITSDDLDLQEAQRKGTTLWEEPIWAPGEITETDSGHKRFVTNYITITEENANEPYLWGNIWE